MKSHSPSLARFLVSLSDSTVEMTKVLPSPTKTVAAMSSLLMVEVVALVARLEIMSVPVATTSFSISLATAVVLLPVKIFSGLATVVSPGLSTVLMKRS